MKKPPDDKLIFLKFDNKNMPTGEKSLGTCNACKNKTYIARYDLGEWPVLICAACECQIGKFGWAE